MGKIKIPYYVVKKGRGYWQPTPTMQKLGFAPVRCGKDGPEAWAIAESWNNRWQLQRRGLTPTVRAVWPRRSLGEAFERLRQTDQWRRMAPRTCEDWERGQRMIEPVFGLVAPSTITLEHIDSFYSAMLKRKGVDAAYRAIKHFRRLWVKMAAMGYCTLGSDPSKGFNRITPAPRFEVWREGEAVRLVKAAWRMGFEGLACIIAVAWDTQFSPVDVRSLTAKHIGGRDPNLHFENVRRQKTGVQTIGTLSDRTQLLMRRYLERYPAEEGGLLFRHRGGSAYSKDKLTSDFRRVRNALFKNDTRRLMDMRRSGAVEASAGNVDKNALAAKMGNSVNRSEHLQKTYQPVNPASVREADDARRLGRLRLRNH